MKHNDEKRKSRAESVRWVCKCAYVHIRGEREREKERWKEEGKDRRGEELRENNL